MGLDGAGIWGENNARQKCVFGRCCDGKNW